MATTLEDRIHRAEPAWAAPARLGAIVVAGTVGLALVNPNTTHVPLCPLKAVTGLDCPLCGGLRAVHALTRFRVGEALSHNALFTLSVPFLVAGWVLWMSDAIGRERDGRVEPRWTAPRWLLPTVLVVSFAFGVLRNLPPLHWLGSSA